MAKHSEHESAGLDNDDEHSRRHESNQRMLGHYESNERLQALEGRLRAYGAVDAPGHDMRVFRRDHERAASLAGQLHALNGALETARQHGDSVEPASRFALQHEYWRLAHEHQNKLGELGAYQDRTAQLEKQLRDHGYEPDPVPQPDPVARFVALEREQDRLQELKAAQRATPAERADRAPQELHGTPDREFRLMDSEPSHRGRVSTEQSRRWNDWVREQREARGNAQPDLDGKPPPTPEHERATWSRPIDTHEKLVVDKYGKLRNVGHDGGPGHQNVTLPRLPSLERPDPEGPTRNTMADQLDRSVGEQFLPRDRTDDAPTPRYETRQRYYRNIEPTQRDIEARARKSREIDTSPSNVTGYGFGADGPQFDQAHFERGPRMNDSGSRGPRR